MKTLGHVVMVVLAFSSCGLLGGGGGGTGGGAGGGGGAQVDFKKGFTFVRKDDRNVYVADSADYQATAVLTQSGNARTPSLSRDGRRVVFVHGASGAESELATVAVTGGLVSTVLPASSTAKNFKTPVFSPDGTRIAFSYDDGASGVSAIGLVNADGSGFVKLKGGVGSPLAYASPSFTADGLSVIAAAGSPGFGLTQLERVPLDGGMTVNLLNGLGVEAQTISGRAVLSLDETKVVFDARVPGGSGTRIFVVDLATKVVTKVNEYAAEPFTSDSFPCWIDATNVAFSSDSGGNEQVYRHSVTGPGFELLVPRALEPWFGPQP